MLLYWIFIAEEIERLEQTFYLLELLNGYSFLAHLQKIISSISERQGHQKAGA